MLATFMYGQHDVRVDHVDEPQILLSTDAVVMIEASSVCGSDLWGYRGVLTVDRPTAKGHEFLGMVTEVGARVSTLRPGDFVIGPFTINDGHCHNCRNGVQPSCLSRGRWGQLGADGITAGGAQAEMIRVPLAEGTLFRTERPEDPALLPHLLTLADVMPTGHHAAVCADVGPGSTVAVVGDGAVGQCGVIAATRLGAERIIMMSRHQDRQDLALSFGATDIVTERGTEGAQQVRDLLGGLGADCVLECVGTDESLQQALAATRPGGQVGVVGLPAGNPAIEVRSLFAKNIGMRGGAAPVLSYIDDLISDVRDGSITPGRVFDTTLDLTDAARGYAAMDSRQSIKTMLLPPDRTDTPADQE